MSAAADIQLEYLVVGAGISGLSFANAIREKAHKAGDRARPSYLSSKPTPSWRLLQDHRAGRLRLGLLGPLLPLQAPRDRGLAARAHAGARGPHVEKRSFIATAAWISTFRSRRTSTSSAETTSSTACTTSTSRDAGQQPAARRAQLQGDALRALRPRHRREVPDPLQREALRLRSRHARPGRDGALLSRTPTSTTSCAT